MSTSASISYTGMALLPLPSWKSGGKRYGRIAVIALTLRLVLFFLVQFRTGSDPLQQVAHHDDSREYHYLAVNMTAHGTFSTDQNPPFTSNATRTPVYPAFVGALYLLFGALPFTVILVQLILDTLNCILTVRLAERFFTPTVSMIAGSFLAFDYTAMVNANRLLSDTLFLTLFLMHILLLLRYMTTRSLPPLLASGLLLAVASLCRPVGMYFFVIDGLLILISPGPRLRTVLHVMLFFAVVQASLAPWQMRNQQVFGTWRVTSMQEDVAHWNAERTMEAISTSGQHGEGGGILLTLRSFLQDGERYVTGIPRFYLTIGSMELPQILDLPYARVNILSGDRSAAEQVIGSKSGIEWGVIIYHIPFFVLIYGGLLGGTLLLIRERRWFLLCLCYTSMAYFTAATAPFAACGRYRLPAEPFIALIAAYAWSRWSPVAIDRIAGARHGGTTPSVRPE